MGYALVMNKLLIRKTHRWLGVVAAIQLLIWTSSGLFFSIIPIDDIRGSHLIEKRAAFRLGHVRMVSPSSLVREHKELSNVSLDQVQIKQRLTTPVYVVKVEDSWLVYHAETAEKLAPLTQTEASAVAANNTTLPVQSATWVEAVEPGSEYRGGELPAWKIQLEGSDHANLWVGANSGQVRAIRTTEWRIYDFLWSLHIMDYIDRDNFNSWLLRGFALLGVITILSGIVLFISSTSWRKRPRLSPERAP
ncbi:MAG: hypothetical protein ABGY96_03515 [bacterium]